MTAHVVAGVEALRERAKTAQLLADVALYHRIGWPESLTMPTPAAIDTCVKCHLRVERGPGPGSPWRTSTGANICREGGAHEVAPVEPLAGAA